MTCGTLPIGIAPKVERKSGGPYPGPPLRHLDACLRRNLSDFGQKFEVSDTAFVTNDVAV